MASLASFHDYWLAAHEALSNNMRVPVCELSTSDTSSAAAERPQLRAPPMENASLELLAPEDAPPMHGMDSPLDLSDTSL